MLMLELKAVVLTLIFASGYVITYGSVLRAPSEGMLLNNDLQNSINKEYNPYTALMNDRDKNNNGNNDEDEDEDNYNRSNNHDMNVFAQIEQFYLNKLQNRKQHLQNNAPRPNPSKMERTAYLLVKTMRQRDKRYVSYKNPSKITKANGVPSKQDLTLCHFKICNMGRKRTTRYFHMREEKSLAPPQRTLIYNINH